MAELQNYLGRGMLSPERRMVVELLDLVGRQRHDEVYGKNPETRKYPKGFIEVLSFVAGARSLENGSENAKRVRGWMETTEYANDGEFDPTVLFDLMKGMQNKVE